MTVFLCQNGFDGILCGVYAAYESRIPESELRLELAKEYDPELFCDYREVELTAWKAGKVAETIRKKMSEDTYVFLYRSALHKSPKRADWIYRFIRLGLSCGAEVIRMMQRPEVYEIFQMNRYVWNEAHLLTGFVRFKKLKTGVFYGRIGPENQVLEIVAGHFADRLSGEDWILYDEKRKTAAVHSRDGRWAITDDVSKDLIVRLEEMAEDDEFIELWKTFFEKIAVKERENPRCQRNFLPLRYRGYMTEFQDSV